MSKLFFRIRNYRSRDFESYVQLHTEAIAYDRSAPPISKQCLAEELGHPSFRPETDMFVAEHDDRIIGYASVFLETAIKRAILACMVHPQHRKKGVATELILRAVQHAEGTGSKMVQVCIPETNLPAKNLAMRLGFEFIRRFYELTLDFTSTRLPALVPRGYIIRSLRRDEADSLTHIQNRAFAGSWGFNPNTPDEIAYRINLSSCSPENVIMAYLKNKPIGYCWTRIMTTDDPAAGSLKGEIHMLGVDPDYRKKGIGRNVLLAGLVDLKSKGVSSVELTADGEDYVAMGLYQSLGFEVCARTEWYQKKLA